MAVIFGGNGGGISGSDDCTARAAQVLHPDCGGGTAITYDSDDEPINGTLKLTGNATEDYVVSGKTFYNTSDEKLTGTLTITSAV